MRVEIMTMSGVEDGLLLAYDSDEKDGRLEGSTWTLSIGRHEDSDICLRNDTFISRQHAYLHWHENRWWLEDLDSKNGTFVEALDDDARVSGTIPIVPGQLFRIGRTWLRLQPGE